MQLRMLSEISVQGKTVLLRADFNVPIQAGVIQDQTRLRESLPTLRYLIEAGAKVVVMSHLGRPKGKETEDLRLTPIGEALSQLLGKTVVTLHDCIGTEVKGAVSRASFGDVILLENLRFHAEEEANDSGFAEALAEGMDLYVNDAFGTIHRAHASTVGVTQFLPSYAGFLVQKEVEILSSILEAPQKPVCLVMGGAKIDTKIGILDRFLPIADSFIIGGALANTFLVAQGYLVGDSLCEFDKASVASRFLDSAKNKTVLLPTDVLIAEETPSGASVAQVRVDEVSDGQKILDLGAQTRQAFAEEIAKAKTILWNGPMGLYEQEAFEAGTHSVAEAIARAEAVKVVGGGDTIDALSHFGISTEKFTHISTGGGAMLEFLEGKMLPGVEVLLRS